MIIKITFASTKEPDFTMMFGKSYKSWEEQYKEFVRSYEGREHKLTPLKIYKSPAKWIGWGGLKWCEEKDFQHQLNREDVQHDEPDNPNPRQYYKMNFKEMDKITFNKLINKSW